MMVDIADLSDETSGGRIVVLEYCGLNGAKINAVNNKYKYI
jgi:hypothetical protein